MRCEECRVEMIVLPRWGDGDLVRRYRLCWYCGACNRFREIKGA